MSLSKWKKRASPSSDFNYMEAVGIAGGLTVSVVLLAIFLAWLATPTPEPACPDLEEIREEILDRASDWCWGLNGEYCDAFRGFRDDDLGALEVKYTDALECHRECPTLTSCQSRDSS